MEQQPQPKNQGHYSEVRTVPEIAPVNREEMNRGQVNEEFAAETVPVESIPAGKSNPAAENRPAAENEPKQKVREDTDTSITGWAALAIAIASLFVFPFILAPASVVLGFMAWYQGSRALAAWSIIIGAVSFFAYLVIVPLYD
jgi:hypothetical protein